VLLLADVSTTSIWIGLLTFAGVLVTTAGGVITAILTKESRSQNKKAKEVVNDFETAWESRGKVIDGQQEDIEALNKRLVRVEEREQNCLEALEFTHHRISVLEAKAGIQPEPKVVKRAARRRT
jgi:hypothetical protein